MFLLHRFVQARLLADGLLTCRQGKGDQVSEEVAGEVALPLMKRGRHLAADLLRQFGTHHGRDALGRLLGHLTTRGRLYSGIYET